MLLTGTPPPPSGPIWARRGAPATRRTRPRRHHARATRTPTPNHLPSPRVRGKTAPQWTRGAVRRRAQHDHGRRPYAPILRRPVSTHNAPQNAHDRRTTSAFGTNMGSACRAGHPANPPPRSAITVGGAVGPRDNGRTGALAARVPRAPPAQIARAKTHEKGASLRRRHPRPSPFAPPARGRTAPDNGTCGSPVRVHAVLRGRSTARHYRPGADPDRMSGGAVDSQRAPASRRGHRLTGVPPPGRRPDTRR